MAKRVTEKEFLEKIRIVSNGEIEHIGIYNGTNKNTTFKHICGHEWSTKPSHIVSDGSRCPKCRAISAQKDRKLSQEEFECRMKSVHGNNIKILSKYDGSHKRITIECNTCGNVWKTKPSHIINDHTGCPKCASHNHRVKNDEFIQKLKSIHNDSILALDDYVVEKKRIRFRCKTCNYEWVSSPNSVINQRTGCPQCSGNVKLTQDEFEKRIREMFNGEMEVLSNYRSRNAKVKLRHKKCGYEWKSSLGSLVNTSIGCPKCSGTLKLTHEEFLARVKEAHGDDIEVLSNYESAHKKVKLRHVCGHEWMSTPHNLTFAKRGCPVCAESKGERFIEQVLSEQKTQFKRQYKFPDCKYQRHLKFDFAIFHNGCVTFLIEYDGGQHFFSVEGWGGNETFENVKKRDSVKNEYCAKNSIPLLRIPYSMTDDDVQNEVIKWLIKYNH